MPSESDVSPSKPRVRAFFSVDLFGSTRLKNVLNHQKLLERYGDAKEAINEFIKRSDQIKNIVNALPNVPTHNEAIIDFLFVDNDDFDWASVVQTFYRDFHAEFLTELDSIPKLARKSSRTKSNLNPWKAVGDELIYVFEIHSREYLHWLTIAFLNALRKSDRKIDEAQKQHQLRLKGSAWVAGFPVRNREVRVPGTKELYDYLGPEIDTGFRLGKCTRPGMLVVSIELAELLSEIPSALDPMTGMIVGWEQLKGVWEDRHYPIIWVDLPKRSSKVEITEKTFWEIQESHFSKEWFKADTPKPSLNELHKTLEEIRSFLPKTLGIVDPYIVGDAYSSNHVTQNSGCVDQVPENHKVIQSLLGAIQKRRPDATKQGASDGDPDAADEKSIPEEKINDMLESIIDPDTPTTHAD